MEFVARIETLISKDESVV